MKYPEIKDTEHEYKGFAIKGRTIQTSGGWVLGMRHWKEGGIARNYEIWEGYKQRCKGLIYKTLKDAKEEVDDILRFRISRMDDLKRAKANGRSKESLLNGSSFPARMINEYYDKI